MSDLERFIQAQKDSYSTAFEEISNGGSQGLILKYRRIQTGRIVIVKLFFHQITFNIESGIYRQIQKIKSLFLLH